MTEQLPPHSPVGASGAYRWMVCPGSVGFSQGVHDEESEFAALGTAAHELSAYCFTAKSAPWEHIGVHVDPRTGMHYPEFWAKAELPEGCIEVDKEMADAVQVFLDVVKKWHPDTNQSNFFVEKSFHCASIHPLFYGRSDIVYIDEAKRTLHVWDYKHGAGIVVDVRDNPQCKYYAIGILEDLGLWQSIDKVILHIVQPRGWHYDGPIRHWATTTEDLETWLDDELLPAMDRAMVSTATESGDHCRFCPARLRACPQLAADMDEMETIMKAMAQKGGATKLTNTQIGRFLSLFDTAKIVSKAANKVAFDRMTSGNAKIPGRKIANSRTNRVWKKGAETALKKALGKDAMTVSELLSPAKIDGLPQGEELTTRWAFKPEGKLTVVAASDTRVSVSKDTKSLFKKHPKKGRK